MNKVLQMFLDWKSWKYNIQYLILKNGTILPNSLVKQFLPLNIIDLLLKPSSLQNSNNYLIFVFLGK